MTFNHNIRKTIYWFNKSNKQQNVNRFLELLWGAVVVFTGVDAVVVEDIDVVCDVVCDVIDGVVDGVVSGAVECEDGDADVGGFAVDVGAHVAVLQTLESQHAKLQPRSARLCMGRISAYFCIINLVGYTYIHNIYDISRYKYN